MNLFEKKLEAFLESLGYNFSTGYFKIMVEIYLGGWEKFKKGTTFDVEKLLSAMQNEPIFSLQN